MNNCQTQTTGIRFREAYPDFNIWSAKLISTGLIVQSELNERLFNLLNASYALKYLISWTPSENTGTTAVVYIDAYKKFLIMEQLNDINFDMLFKDLDDKVQFGYNPKNIEKETFDREANNFIAAVASLENSKQKSYIEQYTQLMDNYKTYERQFISDMQAIMANVQNYNVNQKIWGEE